MDNDLFLPAIEKAPSQLYLATVASTNSSGVTLIFDGAANATTKRYKRLSSYSPTANDRVLVAKMSGTYVVLGKIT